MYSGALDAYKNPHTYGPDFRNLNQNNYSLKKQKLPGYLSLVLLTRIHTPILGWEIHNLHSVDSPGDTRDSPAFSWGLKR